LEKLEAWNEWGKRRCVGHMICAFMIESGGVRIVLCFSWRAFDTSRSGPTRSGKGQAQAEHGHPSGPHRTEISCQA
jgi:hypothetical protein